MLSRSHEVGSGVEKNEKKSKPANSEVKLSVPHGHHQIACLTQITFYLTVNIVGAL